MIQASEQIAVRITPLGMLPFDPPADAARRQDDWYSFARPRRASLADRLLLHGVLAALGIGLCVAVRLNGRCRNQVTRELTVEIGSTDGVFHHFIFRPRTISWRSGKAANPPLAMCFANARQGWQALLHPRGVGRIVEALQGGGATYCGNAALFFWLWGLSRHVVPLGLQRREGKPLPDSFVAPNPKSAVYARITREDPVAALDPSWSNAAAQQPKIGMVRYSQGHPFPLF